MTGYQALQTGAAWLDVSSRGRIRLTGEDRARLLHALTTNHIQQLAPGESCYAYFLTAQGRILADVNILCLEDSLLLDTEPETREKVYQHLDRYIIADDVTLTDETEALAAIAVEGPAAAGIVTGATLLAPWTYTGQPGFFAIVPAADKAALIAKLEESGAVPATAQADFEVTRIENGKPRYGLDLSERFLAQEANQANALHFSKGCYLGQEIVERVRSRGQVHRLLLPVQLETTEPPQPGTKVADPTGALAEVTSAAFSPRLGRTVALAYVRSDRAVPGAELQFGEVKARVGRPYQPPTP